MFIPRRVLLVAALAIFVGASQAVAWMPYMPVPVYGPPAVGPGVQPPISVYGKEFSNDVDYQVAGPMPDPEQVIAWDGNGGTADSIDYSFTRPGWDLDQEVDAIANSRDALFDETIKDQSHLIFSHDDLITSYNSPLGSGVLGAPMLIPVPSGGPVVISNGNQIGGAGEVSVEESGVYGPPRMQWLWAVQPQIDSSQWIDGRQLPIDVDGLEVWGPEPAQISEDPTVPVVSDADKYSLDTDAPSGVSVWNASGTPYLQQPIIAAAVQALLGPIPASAFDNRDGMAGEEAINLDALMVSDILDDTEEWNEEGFTPNEIFDQNDTYLGYEPWRGDSIIFSIRQLVDPTDPDGYYATGSELFVLDSWGGVSFLNHGGHIWDQPYSLVDLALITVNLAPGDYDANGVVDGADWLKWKTDYGMNVTPGTGSDGNGDGVVDAADYTVWRDNLGAVGTQDFGVIDINAIEAVGTADMPAGLGAASLAPASVPEPSAALLALIALGALAARRRG